jgi:NTE family protein
MPKAHKTINIALQGGGAHGALLWGILDKILEDNRIQFDSISATSAGAMNAAVLTYGLIKGGNEGARELLHQFWEAISEACALYSPIKKTPMESLWDVKVENTILYQTFDMMAKLFSPYQLNPLNFNPLRDIIHKLVDFEAIQASKKINLYVSATNVRTGKIKIFENKEMSEDAIMASASLPNLFQATKIGDDYYWDGGYMGNPAIYPLIYNSTCSDILILHVNPIYREHIPETGADIINRINEISFNSSLMREMRAIAFVTKLLDDGWIKEEHAPKLKRLLMHGIRADVAMESHSIASKLNPTAPFVQELFQAGRTEATNWLKESFKHIGVKSTFDLREYL